MEIKINMSSNNEVKLKRAYKDDAGLDVFVKEEIDIYPGRTVVIPLGISVELPSGIFALLLPRTSMSKAGVLVHSCPIDNGYTGEIHAIVTNTTENIMTLVKDSAVAQLVFFSDIQVDFIPGPGVNINIGDKLRGTKAFGSSNAS